MYGLMKTAEGSPLGLMWQTKAQQTVRVVADYVIG
jgi:hypothetical protein